MGLSMFLPKSKRDEEQWYERMAQNPQEERPFAIDLREGNEWRLIGNCGAFGIDWVNRSAELGIMIGDKANWNRGCGAEAMTLMLKHGFETLNLNRIFLRVYSNNPRAIRSYEKTGFKLEGTLREAVFKHGRYDDVHFMSVLRSEWDAREDK
jgi:RimJ/RimL family protein N-acetyltransferase